MSTNREATFIRRKFTLTEELDAELERMAANNYQGNVSLCLRQAITDHRETLNGHGDLTIRRLTESVAHIEDQISDLEQVVDTAAQHPDRGDTRQSETKGSNIAGTDALSSDARQVLAVLKQAETPLRVADIIERVEMQPVDVRQVLGSLIDQGHVFVKPGDTPRYYLAMIETTPSKQTRDGGASR
jgi:hypothetical protein